MADFFFLDELPPYDTAELIPPKRRCRAWPWPCWSGPARFCPASSSSAKRLEAALRAEADSLGLKAGQMFQPIRVAVCGRKAAPPLFETLEVLGRETCLKRIDQAIQKLRL